MTPYPSHRTALSFRFLVYMAALAALMPLAHSADSTWNLNNNGTWLTDSNWTAAAPGSTSVLDNTDTATFGPITTTTRTVTVDANRNLLGINFAGNSAAYLLSGGSLRMTNGGVIQTSGGGTAHTDSISTPIELQGDEGSYTFTADSSTSGRWITFTGGITGVSTLGKTTSLHLNGSNTGSNDITGIVGNGSAGGNLAIIKEGSGNWRLGGVNTYTGGTIVRAGTLTAITSSSAFGTGSITIGDSAGGSADASLLVRTSGLSFANPIVLASTTTGALKIGTTGNSTPSITVSTTFTGGVTGTNNLIIHNGADNGTITFSGGAINHSGALTHTGGAGSLSISSAIGANVTDIIQNSTASMTLSGGNSAFVGNVYVKAGILSVTTSTGLGGLGATVYLGDTAGSANATLRLHNNLNYARPIVVQGGTTGTLTLDFRNNVDLTGPITLNNNLLILNPAGSVPEIIGGITGTGNITISNESSSTSNVVIRTGEVNITGTITNDGTGAATTNFLSQIGANVTSVIQNSRTSPLSLQASNTAFVGTVDVIKGRLESNNNTALSSSNVVRIGNDGLNEGIFDTWNRNQTIAGLNDYAGAGGTATNSGANLRTLTLGGSGNFSFSGKITGNLALTKSGAGIQVLGGANTYTGATAINNGTLRVNGSLASTAVTVAGSGILGGEGTLDGTVGVSGTLAPGNSPGKLTVNNNVTFNTGSTFAAELNGTSAGASYDQLEIGGSGTLSLIGTNNLELTLGYTPDAGDKFTIALAQGTSGTNGVFEQLNGVLTDLSQGAIFMLGGYEFTISYQAEGNTFDMGLGSGNDIMLQVVPEPSSTLLLLLGGTLGMLLRKRDRSY